MDLEIRKEKRYAKFSKYWDIKTEGRAEIQHWRREPVVGHKWNCPEHNWKQLNERSGVEKYISAEIMSLNIDNTPGFIFKQLEVRAQGYSCLDCFPSGSHRRRKSSSTLHKGSRKLRGHTELISNLLLGKWSNWGVWLF